MYKSAELASGVKPEATEGKNAIFFLESPDRERVLPSTDGRVMPRGGGKKNAPLAAARQLVSGRARCCCQICARNDGTRTFWPGKLMPVLYSVRKNVRAKHTIFGDPAGACAHPPIFFSTTLYIDILYTAFRRRSGFLLYTTQPRPMVIRRPSFYSSQ